MTLRKYFREEIRVGATKANTQVAEFLFSTITGVTVPDRPPITDDRARVTAAIFWARTFSVTVMSRTFCWIVA
jgi:hypothetical protein